MIIRIAAEADLPTLILLGSVDAAGGSLDVSFWFVMESGHSQAVWGWNREGIGH